VKGVQRYRQDENPPNFFTSLVLNFLPTIAQTLFRLHFLLGKTADAGRPNGLRRSFMISPIPARQEADLAVLAIFSECLAGAFLLSPSEIRPCQPPGFKKIRPCFELIAKKLHNRKQAIL
jgi:hypothetical protein